MDSRIRYDGPPKRYRRPIPFIKPELVKTARHVQYSAPSLAKRPRALQRVLLRASKATLDPTTAIEVAQALHALGIPLTLFIRVQEHQFQIGLICQYSALL